MLGSDQPSTAATMGRAVVAGVAGTAVMTAFQKLVEMPLTGREDSYAPADFAQRILSTQVDSDQARKQLNYVTHFARSRHASGRLNRWAVSSVDRLGTSPS